MKLRYLIPLMALAVIFYGSALSYAAGPVTGAWPTRWVHDFDCDNCHGVNAYFNTLTTNVCLNCHGQGTTAGQNIPLLKSTPGFHNKANANFAVGDSSDAMGTVTAENPALVGDQTSHSWTGSDTNPAAGATPPVNPLFAGQDSGRNYTGPNVSCSRCHDPHGWMVDYLPYYTGNPKLLKLGVGSEVAMCNDCHVSWASDTAPSEGGTAPTNVHPMVTDYAAIAAAKSDEYNDVTALNAAPGEIALNGTGGIDCLTCHGVHFTDSDANTTDGVVADSVAHLNPSGNSQGKILKADGPGIDNSNLCQTCHKYADHGLNRSGGANAIGCLICHGAHLEDKGGLMNNYMLREEITTYLPKDGASGSVSGLTANITSTPDQKQRLWDYCFTCHDPADAITGHNAGWDCVQCHQHEEGTGSWTASGGCTTCHGYPPVENAVSDSINAGFAAGYDVGAPTNPTNYPKDESVTKHKAHAGGGSDYSFNCNRCHLNNNHIDGKYNDVFLGTEDPLTSSNAQLDPNYVSATGTCSAVYCHSNGGPRGAVPTVNDPGVWENGTAITTCDACHGNDASDMATRNNSAAHIAHLNKGYSCQVCHGDTADDADNLNLSGSSPPAIHVDGNADVVFNASSLSFGLGTTSYGTNGTCSVYCHSDSANNSTPDWDDDNTGACGTCHQYSSAGVATGSGAALGGAHPIHLFDARGPKIATCSTCHTHDGAPGAANSDHVNGVKDVDFTACNPCHGSTNGGTGNDAEPNWAVPASVTCETCHSGSNIAVISGDTAPAKNNFASLGHGDSGLTGAPGCTGCHDATDTGHFDGISGDDKRLKVDPEGDAGGEDYSVSTTAWCQDCHGENAHYNNSHSAIGTDASIDGDTCIICHEPHGDGMGSNTDAMVIVGAGFTDRTDPTSYFNGTNNGVCQVCHDPAEVSHYNTGGDDGHNASTACYSCHSHTSSPQAFQGGECYDCHGDGVSEYWPQNAGNDRTTDAVSDFNDAGRHQKHMEALAAKLTYTLPGNDAQQKEMCAYCHVISDADHAGLNSGFAEVFTGGAKKYWDASNDADATWNTTNYNTCSNIDCHNSKETTDSTYGWYDAGTSACIMCHDDVTGISTHNAHLSAATTATYGLTIVCSDCHYQTSGAEEIDFNDAAKKPGTGHWDGSWTINGSGIASYTGNWTTGTKGSCGTNDCHEDGKGAASVEQLGDGYTWGTAEASACGICHKSSMDTAAHEEHLNSSYVAGCTDCHTAATASTHINDTVNFDGAKVAYNSGTGFCATNLCHAGGDFRDSLPTPMADCENCHSGTYIAGDNTGTGGNNYLPQYNMHDITPTVSGAAHKTIASCGFCHENIYGATTHIDGTWAADSADNSSQDRGIFNSGIAIGFTDGAPATCATVCHFGTAGDGGAWARKWSATAGNNDGTECANCHGDFANGWVSGISQRHSSDAQLAANHGGASTPCMTCHTLGDGAGDYDWATQHRDGDIQLSNDLGWVDHGATVGCSNCHSANDDADDSMNDGEHEMQDTYDGDGADGGLNRWGRVFQNGGGGSCTACHDANGADHGGLTESNAVHAAHLASGYINDCNDCHAHTGPGTPGDTGIHNDGTVDFGGTYIAAALSYAKASDFGGTCATANGCHDSAAGEWKNGLDSAGNNSCIDCHAATGKLLDQVGYPPTSNEHTAHLGNDAIFAPASDCNLCHGTDAVTGGHTGHKNNGANIDLAGSSIAYDGTNCTNSCHTSAANDWTSGTGSLGCADCHNKAANTINTPVHATLSPSVGPSGDKHSNHVGADADYVGAATCTTCHGHSGALGSYATTGHVDAVQDSFSAAITAYPAAAVAGSCTNTCHLAADLNEWTSGTLDCTDCHTTALSLGAGGDGSMSATVAPNSGRHSKHMLEPDYVAGCTDCHSHSGSLAAAGHVNGPAKTDIEVANEITVSPIPVDDTCTNNCHDLKGISTALTSDDPTWTDADTLGCLDCHNGTFLGGDNTGSGGNNNLPQSGLHGASNALDHTGVFQCASCHETTPTNSHLSGGAAQDSTATTYSFGTNILSYSQAVGCAATTGCHNDKGAWSRKWVGVTDLAVTNAMSPGDAVCDNCHGDFDSGFRAGVSGRHTGTDVDTDIKDSHRGDAPNDCNLCHAWGDGNYGFVHRNSIIELNQNVGFEDTAPNDGLVGCANCHESTDGTADEQHSFVDTETDGTEGLERWGRAFIDGPEGSCDTCHDGNISGGEHNSTNDNQSLHDAHNASGYIDTNGNFVAGTGSTYDNCITCHGHNGTGGSHKNGTVNFDGTQISSTYDYAKDSGFGGSCGSTNGCHDADADEWKNGSLGADSCADCHGSTAATFFEAQAAGLDLTWQASPAGPTTTKHAAHLGSSYTINCTECHNHAGSLAHADHLNKAINTKDAPFSYTSGTQTCTNSCHIANTSGDWTAGGSLACDDCHGAANSGNTYYRDRTSGSHDDHVNILVAPTAYGSATNNSSGTSYDFGCGQCHPTSAADHLDGSSYEVQAGINYSGGAAGTCNNNACHNNNGSAANLTANWSTGWVAEGDSDQCNNCHGNAPSSGAHSVHAVGIHADDIDDGDANTEGIYSGTTGNIANSNTAPSAHGDGTTSTVLSCQTCHFSTVNVWYNALNSACANCHDTSSTSLGDNVMTVTNTANHANGTKDVVFMNIQFKSKAQARDDITTITELDNNWSRNNGYKAANSYDQAKTNLNVEDYADSTCTVACHNGIDATWTAPTGNCSACHTDLP